MTRAISYLFRSLSLLLLVIPNSHTFAHNVNGFWKSPLDTYSLIRVEDRFASIHNGNAHMSMDYVSDPSIANTYHFSNLRFNRLALPAALPNISLSTAMLYISLLKKHGATIKIEEEGFNSIMVFWTVKDRSGSFLLSRVL